MHTAIHINHADLVEAFKLYVERRLRFALGRYGARVGQVTVQVDGSGPAENHCRISAEVLPFGWIAVEENDPMLFTAIDRATGRIGRLFGRKLKHFRDTRVSRDSVRLAA
jgi:ribosome-associated translation inhibitor RaiA